MSVDCGTGARHALVDVRLIEFVADFPFERLRDDDAPNGAQRAVSTVQSRSRVGNPRCCPGASQSQIESAPSCSTCAYLRKLRSSAISSLRVSAPVVRRKSELDITWSARPSPRKANGERNRPSVAFHESAYGASNTAVQVRGVGIPGTVSAAQSLATWPPVR